MNPHQITDMSARQRQANKAKQANNMNMGDLLRNTSLKWARVICARRMGVGDPPSLKWNKQIVDMDAVRESMKVQG